MESSEKSEEIIERDGKKYRLIPTQWSEKEYFSHEGPGWDYRFDYMEKKGLGPDDLDKLSDETYSKLEEIE